MLSLLSSVVLLLYIHAAHFSSFLHISISNIVLSQVTYEEAMETIHAIKRDGTIMTGSDALKGMYRTVGWGWIADVMALPIVDKVVDLFYKALAKYRIPLSGTLTAMRRVTLTDAGVEHCVDDEEECDAVSW